MSKIEWTDVSWNPIRGCSRVSAGCDNCYAIRQAARHDYPGGAYHGLTTVRQRAGNQDWSGKVVTVPSKLEEPLRWRKPRRVFVNSMSDLFHPAVPDEFIDRVFAVTALTSLHSYQILTKRPGRMLEYAKGGADLFHRVNVAARSLACTDDITVLPTQRDGMVPGRWPLANVHLGVSVEDQATADERIPLLLQTPAAVRWVSAEPLLGPVGLSAFPPLCWPRIPENERTAIMDVYPEGLPADSLNAQISAQRIDWVVTGGESGPGARPCDIDWIRSIVAQCKAASVPVFVKQLGARPIIPCHWDDLRDRKGGDPAEWPEDLRVREYPE